jgi:hypothetical protein
MLAYSLPDQSRFAAQAVARNELLFSFLNNIIRKRFRKFRNRVSGLIYVVNMTYEIQNRVSGSIYVANITLKIQEPR